MQITHEGCDEEHINVDGKIYKIPKHPNATSPFFGILPRRELVVKKGTKMPPEFPTDLAKHVNEQIELYNSVEAGEVPAINYRFKSLKPKFFDEDADIMKVMWFEDENGDIVYNNVYDCPLYVWATEYLGEVANYATQFIINIANIAKMMGKDYKVVRDYLNKAMERGFIKSVEKYEGDTGRKSRWVITINKYPKFATPESNLFWCVDINDPSGVDTEAARKYAQFEELEGRAD